MTVSTGNGPKVTFSPGLQVEDPVAQYWLRQVTLRLRREIAWLWFEQGVLPATRPDTLPPLQDKAAAALGHQRSWDKKQSFFKNDPTGRYLTEQLQEPLMTTAKVRRGSFAWVVATLQLGPMETFVLAMGLLPVVDSSVSAVLAVCQHDALKTRPTLALAQRLWDQPEQLMALLNPAHRLFHFGLLQPPAGPFDQHLGWEQPLSLPPLIAASLLYPNSTHDHGLEVVNASEAHGLELTATAAMTAARLVKEDPGHARLVPLWGVKHGPFSGMACLMAQQMERPVVRFQEDPLLLNTKAFRDGLATLCWLKGVDLFLDEEQVLLLTQERPQLALDQLPRLTIPITIFISLLERQSLAHLPSAYRLPAVELPSLTYKQRLETWNELLQDQAQGLDQEMAECARRFRFERATISAVGQSLQALGRPLTSQDLATACWAQVPLDMGELAQRVTPRFQEEEVVLPAKQQAHYQELLTSMQALTKVHYEWGTAAAWNESGITALFAGPPGTGKTMAAERLALLLGLPMVRIDLSQVASKYIGETEKNLKRLFDLADIADTILFFDEADALFGKRSEVKDAHDRYANLEISYLLERMERFKGLAILATNRKKDLDEAFVRRLRFIIDFPMPGEEERLRIWQQVIPNGVDRSALDLGYLAKQFPLAGGHIRSVVFQACLQSAGGARPLASGFKGKLSMDKVMVALKREYEKSGRSVSLEQFGAFASLVDQV